MDEKIITQKEHKIIMENRKKIVVGGVDKVESVNLTQICLQVGNSMLFLSGNNLHVDKLDVAAGHVEITGQIDALKYADKKQNFFKRIFK